MNNANVIINFNKAIQMYQNVSKRVRMFAFSESDINAAVIALRDLPIHDGLLNRFVKRDF